MDELISRPSLLEKLWALQEGYSDEAVRYGLQQTENLIYKAPVAAEGWISTEYELPVDDKPVLVCTRSQNGSRNVDKGYFSGRWIHRGTAEVTHWMEIPELPEEEG